MDASGYISSESKTIILIVTYNKINSDENSGKEIQDMAKTNSEIKEEMDVL